MEAAPRAAAGRARAASWSTSAPAAAASRCPWPRSGPDATVDAPWTSPRAALAVARENAARLGLAGRVALRHAATCSAACRDWPRPVDLVVSATRPTSTEAECAGLAPEVRDHEPRARPRPRRRRRCASTAAWPAGAARAAAPGRRAGRWRSAPGMAEEVAAQSAARRLRGRRASSPTCRASRAWSSPGRARAGSTRRRGLGVDSRPWKRSASSAAGPSRARSASPGPRTRRCPTSARRCSPTRPSSCSNVPEVRDIRTMGRVLAAMGARSSFQRRRRRSRSRPANLTSVEAHLRPGQDHARLGAGAGAAAGPRGPRPRLAARRLRHRRPPHRPPPAPPSRRWGRTITRRARLRGGQRGQAAARGRDLLRHRHRHRHREHHDGGHPGRGRDRHPQRGLRAGDRATWPTCWSTMGARIQGAGGPDHPHRGRGPRCSGAEHTVIPDRIETGTFMAACAIAGRRHRDPELPARRTCAPSSTSSARPACASRRGRTTCACARRAPCKASDVTTLPHPGFPTDMQAQYMALMTQAAGASAITESIFENRYMHVAELQRMGANDPRRRAHGAWSRATRRSPAPRSWPPTCAPRPAWCWRAWPPRARPIVDRVYHLDRGYYRIDEKLRGLGADIERDRPRRGLRAARRPTRRPSRWRTPS